MGLIFRQRSLCSYNKNIHFNLSNEIFFLSRNRGVWLLLLLPIILIPETNVFSQNQLTGKVYRANDSTAIYGASVYFDGTSIGVSTNKQGYYEILFKENNSSLIISSLGYDPVIIKQQDYNSLKSLPDVYLKEKLEELNTVHLETDPWSRLRKLRIFKREFLGSNKSASNCKIINEDSIELRYIPSSKTLVARSNEPLIIENKYLGYVVKYNLTDFKVKFKKGSSGLLLPFSTYYEGFSFFEPLKKRLSKKIMKNRKLSYLGSSLHFMRSLYKKKLEENNFKIFYERFQVPTYKYFDIVQNKNMIQVELLVDEIAILYNDIQQSGLITKGRFTIDYFGNHSPPESIILKGDMSYKRISELLPLDYNYEL